MDIVFPLPPARPWLRFRPLWNSPCLPQDLPYILERRAPTRNGAHPNWHLAGHEQLARSQGPTAALRACTLGRASIIHCLLFINNPSLYLHPSLYAHTLLHPPQLHISTFLYFTHHLLLYWRSGRSSSLKLWAMWALVQCVEAPACPTCHFQRNKGARFNTCPCYAPLCIFNVSAIPPGKRSVSDKSHTMGNTFLNSVQEPAAVSQATATLKLPIVSQNFIFIMCLFNVMRLLGQFCLGWKRFELKASADDKFWWPASRIRALLSDVSQSNSP